MSNLRPFQIFLLGIFGFLAILAVVLLSGFAPGQDSANQQFGQRVLIWGTLDRRAFDQVIEEVADENKQFEVVSYEQIDPRTFNDTLVSAIAEGRSPDLILLPNSELVRQRNRLLALSYDTVSKRQFRDSYVDGADIFAREDGIYALPLVVDPLVMYWNRDLLASGGLVEPPQSWESIVSSAVPSLTKRDNNRNILASAVSFGEVRNVRNAKEILLLLALQSGSKMVFEENGQYKVSLNQSQNTNGLPPLEAAVNFYTSFSNSNSQLYSWNRSLPEDRNSFVSEDLAIYFGYGSELPAITEQNPNLNFDVAPVPQGASASVKRTYGEYYGLAIIKASPNPQGAYLAASTLTQPKTSYEISQLLRMAPASRSALAASSEDPFNQIIFNATITARGWLDPNTDATDKVFQDMIENVTSGRAMLSEAVNRGVQQVKLVF